MGKRGRKLLIYVSRSTKRLNSVSQDLHISRLIASLYLESAFRGGKYSSKPYVMCLRWLAVKLSASDIFSNSLRLVRLSIVH